MLFRSKKQIDLYPWRYATAFKVQVVRLSVELSHDDTLTMFLGLDDTFPHATALALPALLA